MYIQSPYDKSKVNKYMNEKFVKKGKLQEIYRERERNGPNNYITLYYIPITNKKKTYQKSCSLLQQN